MNYSCIRDFIKYSLKENQSLDSAQVLSQYAHRDQKRRSGKPYFLHPQEVANIVKVYYTDTVTYYTAMLHDALEDGIPLGNINDEDHFFDLLVDELPEADFELAEPIYSAVQSMTKQQDKSYIEYVDSLTHNEHALRVKLADVMQNISDNPSPRQIKKYANAKSFLVNKFNNKPPPGISTQHWNDFKKTVDNVKEE
jgi:(p)ppGpp synthase/HD superfamily hydrolase